MSQRLRLPRLSFPLLGPTWPTTAERPREQPRLGEAYDTAWARSYTARLVRAVVLDELMRPAVKLLGRPAVGGLDRLDDLRPPAIFVANHASHLDTGLLLSALPDRFRHRIAVAAAADYFFDTTLKAHFNALTIGAFPVERHSLSRRALDLAASLLGDGWSLVVYPEGGRTPDGWAQEFKGGAAFLSRRCSVPIVPVHLEGTRRILAKGQGLRALRPSTTHVTIGHPLWPGDADTRSLTATAEQAVAMLADEQATSWWDARRRAAAGTTPSLRGPEASGWRRAWALDEGRKEREGPRWDPTRHWPAPRAQSPL